MKKNLWLRELLLAFSIALHSCSSGPPPAQPPSSPAPPAATTAPPQTPSPESETALISPIKTITGTVAGVIDGDTAEITILDSGKREKVPLHRNGYPGVHHQVGSLTAGGLQLYQERAEGKRVYLELDAQERDKYGRLLAYIWLEEPAEGDAAEVRAKMFNAMLLMDGYAQVITIPPNVKYSDLFVELQGEAREEKKGLWGVPSLMVIYSRILETGRLALIQR